MHQIRLTRISLLEEVRKFVGTFELAETGHNPLKLAWTTRDATMTSEIITRIEAAAQKLAAAQGQADRYLDEVTDVLAQSHQSFADNMRKTVGEANTQFHQQLAQATGLLRDTIQDLELALPSGHAAGESR